MFISQKIIFINRTIIQVTPEKNDKSSLNIKVYEKESEHPTNYTFSNNANGQVISMGCGDEANIHIKTDGNLIALIHERLKYDKQRDIWEIMDECGSKQTTSGTWVALDHKIGIEEDIILKLGDDIMKVSII